jgi:hypothetical protein
MKAEGMRKGKNRYRDFTMKYWEEGWKKKFDEKFCFFL